MGAAANDFGEGESGGGGLFGSGSDMTNWLNWFPKIGVFGFALIGVVIWNVRKVTNQRSHDRLDDLDDESFKERLREAREKRKARENKEKVEGGLGQEIYADRGNGA